METSYRPLLPATNSDSRRVPALAGATPTEGESSSSQGPSLPRRAAVIAACKVCKRRKKRCDGRRPICGGCVARELDCVWDTLPGMSRHSATKVRNEKLETAMASMLEVFWYLQTRPVDEARELLQEIRSSADVSSVLNFLQYHKEATQSTTYGQMPWQELGLAASQPDISNNTMAQHSDSNSNSPSLTSVKLLTVGEDAIASVLSQPFIVPALTRGMRSFALYTGSIFYISQLSEADRFVQDLLEHINKQETEWIWTDNNYEATNKKALLSELCGVTAVGLQYNGETFDAESVTDERVLYGFAGCELAKMFYGISKLFLDESIESNPYGAMRTCTLLAIYDIMEHSSIAVAYTDLGLIIGMNHGLFGEPAPVNLSREDFRSHKKVVRTLGLLRGWLTATLGYLPSSSIDSQLQHIHVPGEPDDHTQEIIEEKIAQVTTIASNFIRVATSFKALSPAILRDVKMDFQRWHDTIPSRLQLEDLVAPTCQLLPKERHSALYMHLFARSIIVLKARSVHAHYLAFINAFDNPEMRATVLDGLSAAGSTAEILECLMSEKMVFRKSWLCISSAFCSTTVLLWAVAQSILSNKSTHFWRQYLESAQSCYKLLQMCAPVHKVANYFQETVQEYLHLIEDEAEKFPLGQEDTEMITADDLSNENNYLFDKITGTSALHTAYHAIHRIVGRPFAGAPQRPGTQTMQAAREANPAARLDWATHVTSVFNGEIRQELRGDTLRDPILSQCLETVGAGHFVDSQEPHGWLGLNI